MLDSIHVTYVKDGWDLDVEVTRANVRRGMVRTILATTGKALYEETPVINDTEKFGEFLLRISTYPDIIAATVSTRGFKEWPISFEEYLDLPEEFAGKWESAAYRLNPSWLPSKEEKEEAEKKVKKSSKG